MSDVMITAEAAQSGAAPTARARYLGAAALTAVICGGLAYGARAGWSDLLVAVAVVQAIFVVSWVVATRLPGRIGCLVIGVLAAGAADAVLWAWPDNQLGPLAAVLGLAVPAMFIHQLTRGVVRTRVVESLSDIAVAVIVVVALSALLQLRHETGGSGLTLGVITSIGAALVTGFVVDAFWSGLRADDAVPRGLLGVVASVVVGAAAGYVRLQHNPQFTTGAALLLGAIVALLAATVALAGAFMAQNVADLGGRVAFSARLLFAVILPIALTAPIGYVLCLALRS